MSRNAYIKFGELCELVVYVKNPDGTAYDLTGGTIQFRLDKQDVVSTVLTRTGNIKGSATLGQARYTLVSDDWTAESDVLSEGDWDVLVKVTQDSGSTVRFSPGRGTLQLTIGSPLA